jgi:hypothetical protein
LCHCVGGEQLVAIAESIQTGIVGVRPAMKPPEQWSPGARPDKRVVVPPFDLLTEGFDPAKLNGKKNSPKNELPPGALLRLNPKLFLAGQACSDDHSRDQ